MNDHSIAAKDEVFDSLGRKPEYWTEAKAKEYFGSVEETDDGTYRTVNGIICRWDYGTGTWVKEGDAPTEKEAEEASKRAPPFQPKCSPAGWYDNVPEDHYSSVIVDRPMKVESVSFGGGSFQPVTNVTLKESSSVLKAFDSVRIECVGGGGSVCMNTTTKIYTCGWDYAVPVKDCLPEKPKCAHDWRPSAKGKKWCASCGVYEDPKPPDFPAPEPTPPMPEERYD